MYTFGIKDIPLLMHEMPIIDIKRCFERRIPLKIVSKWLGHSKVMHTLDIYTHVLPDLERQAIEALELPMTASLTANGGKNPIDINNPMPR